MSEIRRLDICYDVSLSPMPPFNFEGTVHKPAYFPSGDCTYEDGTYWQTMRFGGHILGLRMANEGSIDEPRVALRIFSDKEIPPEEIKAIAEEITYRFDLDADITGLEKYAQDEILRPVLARWRGMRVSTYLSLYEYLVVATVLQNAPVRRSVQMLDNLFNKYGSKVEYDHKVLCTYWAPEAIAATSEEELRALKVGYRAKQLKKQAQIFVSGELDEFALRALASDALREVLISIYGIGPASVWYLMFEVFKRYDAFDYISPWEQKIYSKLLFDEALVDKEIILKEVDSRWGEWKMLGIHYIFEDLFWQRKTRSIPWLEELIRL